MFFNQRSNNGFVSAAEFRITLLFSSLFSKNLTNIMKTWPNFPNFREILNPCLILDRGEVKSFEFQSPAALFSKLRFESTTPKIAPHIIVPRMLGNARTKRLVSPLLRRNNKTNSKNNILKHVYFSVCHLKRHLHR